jgi:hypothetical protein
MSAERVASPITGWPEAVPSPVMAGRDRDYDDWFDEPIPPPDPRRRTAIDEPDEESWTVPSDFERPPSRERKAAREPIVIAGRELTTPQLVIAAVAALAIILAILAAAGVFSSSSPKATPPVTTPTTITTPTTPATTTTHTTPSTPRVQVPTTTIKPGDTGSQVVLLQKALNQLGYSVGTADGSYGPTTETAVKSFQTDHNLTADGVVGTQTLAAMKTALQSKSG